MKKQIKSAKDSCRIFYHDLYGKKDNKYEWLLNNSIDTVNWVELRPERENFFFSIKDFTNDSYNQFLSLINIFKLRNMGVASGKDADFVKFNKNQYKFEEQDKVADYFYRPFDNRKILYDIKKLQRARFNIMKNVQSKNTILCIGRFAKNKYPQVIVTSNLVCRHSVTDMTYIFPLYILSNGEEKIYLGIKGPSIEYKSSKKSKDKLTKTPNFTEEFNNFIKSKYSYELTPEKILGYIYSVLYSPTYRTKYIEFLKIDFPRIPFTDDEKLFNELSDIGFELIEHHLLKKEYNTSISKFHGETDNYKVEKVEYDEKEQKVSINKDRYFQPVPANIWNFYIGGYQVLDKWLKERKKHEISLSGEDIRYFLKVIDVLDFTIKTMKKIDNLTNEWI